MATDKQSDTLDDLLDLEDQYYNEGYNLGVEDGSRAGRIEGRVFGLEKSCEKFLQMGRLSGRASIWSARISRQAETPEADATLRPMSGSDRLKKHIHRLKELTDPETLSTQNDEEDVAEFDDRLKDASAKAILISKMVGEHDLNPSAEMPTSGTSSKASARTFRVKNSEAGQQMTEMEDFLGLPGISKNTG